MLVVTEDQYRQVCAELDITFYEGGLVATPQQLAVKAQLLRRYFYTATHISRVGGSSPEIIIHINGIVINICFPSNDTGWVHWWKDFPPDFLPRLADFKAAYLGDNHRPLDEVVAKVEEIVNDTSVAVL